MSTTTDTTFRFNGDYHNLEQVAPWLDEFNKIYDEITGAGDYPYNDSFKGRIPGIGNQEKRPNTGTHEDAAIYLLQGLRRQREQDAKIAALKSEGYEEITELDGETRFRHVIFFPNGRMNGEWAEWRDARLLPEENAVQGERTGRIRAVLPKGKRTHGHLCDGRRVLVLR